MIKGRIFSIGGLVFFGKVKQSTKFLVAFEVRGEETKLLDQVNLYPPRPPPRNTQKSAHLSSSIDKKLRPTISFNGTPYLEERFLTAVSLIGNAFVVSLLNMENMVSIVDLTVSCIFSGKGSSAESSQNHVTSR